MLKIRLQRVGRKHEPSFRLVLTDSKNSTKSGKYLEILGNYDSRRGEKAEFKNDRISHWLEQGAQASTTVHNILLDRKVITGKKINALPLKKAIEKEKVAETPIEAVVETPKTETPAEEIAPVAPEAPEVETPSETPPEEKTEASA